jgi:hypothetical protein
MSDAARAGGRDRPVRLAGVRAPGVGRRALVALELVTGAAGLARGVPLAASPDGSLLRADPAVLAGTPFSDWRGAGGLLAGDGAQPTGDGSPGPAAGFQIAGEALDVCTASLEQADAKLLTPADELAHIQRVRLARETGVTRQEPSQGEPLGLGEH